MVGQMDLLPVVYRVPFLTDLEYSIDDGCRVARETIQAGRRDQRLRAPDSDSEREPHLSNHTFNQSRARDDVNDGVIQFGRIDNDAGVFIEAHEGTWAKQHLDIAARARLNRLVRTRLFGWMNVGLPE